MNARHWTGLEQMLFFDSAFASQIFKKTIAAVMPNGLLQRLAEGNSFAVKRLSRYYPDPKSHEFF